MIIKDKDKLKETISSTKRQGEKVLIKRGVFDLLHPGHILVMRMLEKHCDVLVILVISDKCAEIKKGEKRPINPQKQRMEVIDGIKGVDYVFADKTISREEYISFLEFLSPDIVAVTSVDSEKTRTYSRGNWKLKEFPDKRKPGFSTTDIIKRIIKKYCGGVRK